jgi:alpha-glucosidase
MVATRTWWKDGTVYQIWPASYKDSNGDGVGDIPGIISTLDYLKDLGVDIIWISPMYASPQADMGYDISDYENIDPRYGTLADAERLIEECHGRDIRIIFDLVINHSSDAHAWFQESRSSKENPKRDWYIWRPAKYDADGHRKPPNNWRSHFGGSAWSWDERTQEYYLHLFLPEQPDFNWENEATRSAIYASSMRFWLDRGLDGFRIDTVNMYSKGDVFPDAPVTDPRQELQFCPDLFTNGPRMHEFLSEMHEQVLAHYDCMTVGELPNTHELDRVLPYVSAKASRLNMVFQFDAVDLGHGYLHKYEPTPWALPDLKAVTARMQSLVDGNDGWTTSFLENHDQGRSISRYASDAPPYRVPSGRMLAMFLATLTGTLYIYQGQEIGMINIPPTWTAAELRDVEAINYLRQIKEERPDDERAVTDAMAAIRCAGRDNARTPVQWDRSSHAGFTTGEPWMRVHDLYREINVADERRDPDSVLSFWKVMLALRKRHVDLCAHGRFQLYHAEDKHTFTYTKEFQGQKLLVCLNFTEEARPMHRPAGLGALQLLMSSVPGVAGDELTAFEGRAYLVE